MRFDIVPGAILPDSAAKRPRKNTRTPAAWCMASQAFRSALLPLWKSFSKWWVKGAASNVRSPRQQQQVLVDNV